MSRGPDCEDADLFAVAQRLGDVGERLLVGGGDSPGPALFREYRRRHRLLRGRGRAKRQDESCGAAACKRVCSRHSVTQAVTPKQIIPTIRIMVSIIR